MGKTEVFSVSMITEFTFDGEDFLTTQLWVFDSTFVFFNLLSKNFFSNI